MVLIIQDTHRNLIYSNKKIRRFLFSKMDQLWPSAMLSVFHPFFPEWGEFWRASEVWTPGSMDPFPKVFGDGEQFSKIDLKKKQRKTMLGTTFELIINGA